MSDPSNPMTKEVMMLRYAILCVVVSTMLAATGCGRITAHVSNPVVLADGTVIQYTTGEYTNLIGQNTVISQVHRQPSTQPVMFNGVARPGMDTTATVASSDRGMVANAFPSMVTSTGYVLGKSVEDNGDINNVTRVNGGNATGGTANGGAGGNATGGAGGAGGVGKGGEGGKGGTGGSSSSSPNVRVVGPTVNNSNNNRTSSGSSSHSGSVSGAVANNSNKTHVGVGVGVNQQNTNQQGQGQGQGQNNHGRWPSPDDYDHNGHRR